jgi:hypothetical protein
MRYLGLAVDFDGTLATDGLVSDATVDALVRLRASGRRLVMATGRQLSDLRARFVHVDLFDAVVAENGGLIYRPASGLQTVLGPAPSAALVDGLRARCVPISVGSVVVATLESHRADAVAVIRELGLDCQVILNKGAAMLLPAGVNKGTGVARAAAELSLPLDALVGVGDAQNDDSLLGVCGVGVAVANALVSLKAQADLVTIGARGDGVIEVIDRILEDDLGGIRPRSRGRRGT